MDWVRVWPGVRDALGWVSGGSDWIQVPVAPGGPAGSDGPEGSTPPDLGSEEGSAARDLLLGWAWSWAWSRAVATRLDPATLHAWQAELPPPGMLSLALDVPADAAASWLETDAHALKRLLEWAGRDRAPWIRIPSELRPSAAKSGARRDAGELLDRLPTGRFHLLATDRPTVLELLSPVARDLAGPLAEWALRTEAVPAELAQAVGIRPDDPDLLGLVAEFATRGDREVEAERSGQEASQGMLRMTWRQGDGCTAVVHLDRLAAPDPRVRTALRTLSLPVVVVAGSAGPAWLAWLQTLLDSGRVHSLAVALACRVDAFAPVVPELVSTDEDAVRVDVERLTEAKGFRVHRAGGIGIHPDSPFPPEAMGAVRAGQRARVLGALAGGMTLSFYPSGWGLSQRMIQLQTQRLSLVGLAAGPDRPVGAWAGRGLSGRFRA